ncbi:MAG: 5-carboxymethyl-2-hydroxymuconate semialdehyde dehydrogenase [Methanomassiliicoccales archaeon]
MELKPELSGSIDYAKRHGIRHFIAGEFRESAGGGWFENLNPSTNEVLCRVAGGDAADIDAAVKSAARAFETWGRTPGEERAAILHLIAKNIRDEKEVLAYAESLDTGIPITQTMTQVERAAENFDFFADMIRHVNGEVFKAPSGFTNYTEKKPIGVAGLITPWNTPLMLETWKLAPCLAAGDTCVLKPAEWSPMTAWMLAHLLLKSNLPKGAVNIVQGFGETAGASLVAHPSVRLISFTGETETGKLIIKNGADTLKRFSMELGGKSPLIIFEDADLRRALDAAVFGVFSLNGERCTANSRVLVHDSIYDEVADGFREAAETMKVGDPLEKATELGPLIHPSHLERVLSYLSIGREEGAKITAGGGRPRLLDRGNFLLPTVFEGVDNRMHIAQEEIFGPVVCLMRFESEEEAIRIANDVQYGLASYVWTENLEKAHRVASELDAGLCWINSQNVRDLRTPFGGAKNSGIGREGGKYSFDFYMEDKTIHVATGKHRIPVFGRRG